MQWPCRSREGGRDRRSGSFLASAVDPRRPPTRPGGGGLGSARGPGFAVASRRLRSGYLVEHIEVCWPSLIPAPDGSPPSSPPVAPLSFPPFPAARWSAPCGRSKNGGKGRGGPKGAGNRSAAMQKKGRRWSPAPPSAAPFLLAARQTRATSTAQVFMGASLLCRARRQLALWAAGCHRRGLPGLRRGACRGFARASLSQCPSRQQKGGRLLVWLPPGVWRRCFGSLSGLRGRLPVGGPFGPSALQCPPIGQSVPPAHQKSPSGAVCGPCGAWGYVMPHPAPVGGLLGPIFGPAGHFRPCGHACPHGKPCFVPSSCPSWFAAGGCRSEGGFLPGAVTFPRLRPAGRFRFAARCATNPARASIKNARQCLFWLIPSPVYPRPCRGFPFLAESIPSIPPGPPFLPPPRSGGGQGGLSFSATNPAAWSPGEDLFLLFMGTSVPMMEKYIPNLCHFAHSQPVPLVLYCQGMALKSPI